MEKNNGPTQSKQEQRKLNKKRLRSLGARVGTAATISLVCSGIVCGVLDVQMAKEALYLVLFEGMICILGIGLLFGAWVLQGLRPEYLPSESFFSNLLYRIVPIREDFIALERCEDEICCNINCCNAQEKPLQENRCNTQNNCCNS